MIAEIDQSTGEYKTKSPTPPREVSVVFGAATHPGRVRENNEDHYLIATLAKVLRVESSSLANKGDLRLANESGHLLVVADGMGGAAAGEKASALAISTVEDFTLNTVKWFLRLPGREEHALLGELRVGLETADRRIVEQAEMNPRLTGMGTTLTMAFHVGEDLFIVHAGDSRAYLYREGELEQITSDHTLVQVLVAGGLVTPEAARTHKRRHVVTNVLGGPREGVQVEVHKVRLQDADLFLLCSDGLTEPLSDPQIAEILVANPDPGKAADVLVQHALARGGPDNVTVLTARFTIKDPAAPEESR
jgi:serine/threonine protein phosphatase PrpC